MFTPEKMEQIHVLFSQRDLEGVVDAVVQQGMLQIVDSADIENWAQSLSKASAGEATPLLVSRQDRITSLFKQLQLNEYLRGIQPSQESWNEIEEHLSKIEHKLQLIHTQKKEHQEELNRLVELKTRIAEVPNLGFALEHKDSYSYLAIETGKVSTENLEILKKQLESTLHVLAPLMQLGNITTIMAIALRRDKDKLQSALREAGFEPLALDKESTKISPEFIADIDKQISGAKEKLRALNLERDQISSDEASFLKSVLYKIRREILKQQILKYFRKTDKTYLLSGWLPSNERSVYVAEMMKATQNRCVIEDMPAEKIESVQKGDVHVPVQLKNPALVRPFELITNAYGTPAYQTIDPTPILGVSFLFMFGMMFGDVGHGLVLALTGLLMLLKGQKPMMKQAGMLLLYAGGASMVFGFLFGSIFGLEHFLPTLWTKPMESIGEMFKICIYFGMGMIFLAIVINLINGFRKGDYLHMIFDKAGLLAAILYWTGIVLVTRIVTTEVGNQGELPIVIPILMIGSIALLFLREPIIHLAQGKKELFPEGVATGLMGGVVEIVEISLGFLANTVSFIRVAAFGLAHAGLFMAVFALSDAVKDVAGGLISAIVILLGNIGIIALEGLVVSIQIVRLEFYEFFSRFFQQGESVYHPLKEQMEKS